MTNPPRKAYNEKSIQSLQGLGAIRKKPTMYIGDLDIGAWSILREVADNAVDEALEGHNSLCHIILAKTGNWVIDNGRGIPVKDIPVIDPVTHKKHQVSALKAIVALTHTSGKFDDKAYSASRGTHGVGVKCTTALSEKFQVWTFFEGSWYTIAYESGKEVKGVTKTTAPKLPNGSRPKKGTVVFSKPDSTILPSIDIPAKLALQWGKVTAYLCPGLKVIVEKGERSQEFFFKNGPKDFVKDRVTELKAVPLGAPALVTSPLVDLALAFTDYDGNAVGSYVNGLENIDGGTHLDSLYKALSKALVPYKKAKQKFTINEVKEGLVGLVNCKLSSPRFSSQTKEKLVDERAGGPLEELLLKELATFFKGNKALAGRICERADKLKELKGQFTASKKVIRELNSIKRSGFPAKFSPSAKAPPEKRELYLVEGESAGGSARQARNKDFQEVLPLKGKPLNAMRHSTQKVTESQEIIYIMAALGFAPDVVDPYNKLRVGKIILLADGDADGAHINSLLLAFFYRYLPKLFTLGKVYVVDAPEYIANDSKTGALVRGKNKEDILAKVSKGTSIKHIKGWGELDPDELAELAFNSDSRRLIKVTPAMGKEKADFVALMSENADYRKELLGV